MISKRLAVSLVCAITLRLPSDILTKIRLSPPSPTPTYITRLQTIMWPLHPNATSKHYTESIYTHPSLYSCSHVYLRLIGCSLPYNSRLLRSSSCDRMGRKLASSPLIAKIGLFQ
ncbi:hypothetical protein CDAR_506721 [Caerostris darwini]|uniref:Secreted protein n=1 Tax=Caerostris darwini TaxID=1538125 RepID=A0AAV4P3E9_9ARAC|nr:hypothetical protein CDAR_506721 [Caerostris darwini]